MPLSFATPRTIVEINWAKLGMDLKVERTKKRMHLREVAAEIGDVTGPTICRLEQGWPVKTRLFFAVCFWAYLQPDNYVRRRQNGP